jgi:DNA-binding ferritin-like protein (Dps family)
MSLWETMTGSDLTREWKAFEARAGALPADYQAAWQQVKAHLFPYGDFTGRNLMPIMDSALGLLEETAADGLGIHEVLGEDIKGFCVALADGEGARSYRERWRAQLNRNVARKLGQLGGRRGHPGHHRGQEAVAGAHGAGQGAPAGLPDRL